MNINQILNKLDKLFMESKTDEAEIFLSENLTKSIKENDTGAIITILNELIGLYRDTSQYEKGTAYCGSLLKLIDSCNLKNSKEGATSYLNIANLYRACGNYKKSFELYSEVRIIYDSILDKNDYLNASYYNNLSLLYQEVKNFKKSCECLSKALEIIKKYDSPYETASTYANLALSYLHGGNIEFAEENAIKSLEIFERDSEKDFHYSSALSAMAGIMTVKKDYKNAVKYYEKALEEMHRNTGYTHAYARVFESMENLEIFSDNEFKGINLSEQYYEIFGKPMIKEKFTDYEDKIAVGLIGEGSDCYGFDDRVSRDHDFGCGFCMWLTDDVYNEIGECLEEEYNKLPEYFRGIPKLKIRRGVYKISDFIENLTGLKNFPKNNSQWLDIPEYALSVLTNGKIFQDKSGIFSALREKYNYYPENIRNIKLSEALAKASQNGQYNYARAMSRNDVLTAKLHINDFADSIINIAFILNRKYMPHRKWQTKFIENFSILSELYDDIIELLSKMPETEKWSEYLPEEWYGRINYNDFHICLIEKICSEISSVLSNIFNIPKKNYLELCAKEIFKLNSKENIIENIINIEWKMFDKVQNTEGRASCQDDFETFDIMRKSQYMTWNENLLQSYLNDLHNAEKSLRNLISEKYARMMEYTSPDEYAEIAGKLPEISDKQRSIINQIAEIQAGWFEEFAEKYPKLANNARSIHSYEDDIYNTSYETYLKGELSVYSPETLELYGRFIVNLYNSGKNLAEMTIKNTVILYGYTNLDDAENKT